MKQQLLLLVSRAKQVRRRRWLGIPHNEVRVGKGVTFGHKNNTPQIQLGRGVKLYDFVRLHGKISIGDNTAIHDFAFLDAHKGSITIGSNCSVHDYCHFAGSGGLTIGNDVRIASHTVISTSNHNFSDPDVLIRLQGNTFQPTTIEDDCWLGAHVTILSGVTVGRGSVIGAGSVVTRDVPPYSVVVGNPARVVYNRKERAKKGARPAEETK